MESPAIHGTGVLLQTSNGAFLLQERDKHAPMYPERITSFGGGLEGDEIPAACAVRELEEELELITSEEALQKVGVFSPRPGVYLQMFLLTGVSEDQLVLHEGRAIRRMRLEEALQDPQVTDFTKEVLRSLT